MEIRTRIWTMLSVYSDCISMSNKPHQNLEIFSNLKQKCIILTVTFMNWDRPGGFDLGSLMSFTLLRVEVEISEGSSGLNFQDASFTWLAIDSGCRQEVQQGAIHRNAYTWPRHVS